MNSLAIWHESNHDEQAQLDLHFNHWKLCKSDNTLSYFLDIGIKVVSTVELGEICLFLPFTISKADHYLIDLGEKLKEKQLSTAIFNEDYGADTSIVGKGFLLKEGSNSKYYVYCLAVENDLTYENRYGGTIIKFKHQLHIDLPTYYRFRVIAPDIGHFSNEYKPNNSFLESAFSSVEIIDFRVNDRRNLDISLVEHITSQKQFQIKLIHYFVMRSIDDEYILSNKDLDSLRLLEKDIWSAYIDGGSYKYQKSIAYHLKEKIGNDESGTGISDFIALLKFRFPDRNIKKYLLYVTAFALLTGLLVASVYDSLKSFFTCFI